MTNTSACGSPSPGPCPPVEQQTSPGQQPVGRSLPLPPPSPVSPLPETGGKPVSPTYSSSASSGDDQVAAPTSADVLTSRGGRRNFSGRQLVAMRELYTSVPYPSKVEYDQLAAKNNMDPRSVKLWFQNRRSKARKHSSPVPLDVIGDVSGDDDDATSDDSSSSPVPRSPHRAHSGGDRASPPGDDGDATEKRAKTDAVTSAQTEYAQMTVMSLPPDHPFCQLLPSAPVKRRARAKCPPPQLAPAVPPENVVSTAARSRPARGGRNRKRASRKTRAAEPVRQQTAAPVPPASAPVDTKPEAARLWRPLDPPRSTGSTAAAHPLPEVKSESSRPSTLSSPLDLSVSLKRKREALTADDQHKAVVSGGAHPALAAGYPMMYPGAFPYYHHPASTAYLPPLMHHAHVPFGMPHLPLGLYGQPLGMWGAGLSPIPHNSHQKSVQ